MVVFALFALTLLGVALPSFAAVSRPVFERRLASGLRVVVCPDMSAPDVSVLVWYDVGSRDEPGGLEGLAHLVEHLMFTGSKHVAPGEHLRLLVRAGATNLNGVTTIDSTAYFETVPPERLELALWLESDRMGYLLDRMDEAALTRERAAVLNEYRDKVTDAPLGKLPEIVLAELFPRWHPYSHAPAGRRESIERITLADARAFVSTWYSPSNAVLTIAGRADPAAAFALSERYFGSLPARKPPARPALPALPPIPSTVLQVGAQVAREEVRIAWLTPRLGAPGDVELDVAAAILAARESGWLGQKLLGSPRLATYVGAGQRSMDLASIFEIRAVVADGRDAADVLSAIDEALARFETHVTPDEMQRAQSGWYNAKLFGLETSFGWASRVATELRIRPSLAPWFDGALGKYAAITQAGVRHAVRTYLRRERRIVTIVRPSREAPLAGELLDRDEVE